MGADKPRHTAQLKLRQQYPDIFDGVTIIEFLQALKAAAPKDLRGGWRKKVHQIINSARDVYKYNGAFMTPQDWRMLELLIQRHPEIFNPIRAKRRLTK